MTYGKILNQYKKTNVETAGKVDLVIMCYEKAIQLLTESRTHYEENEFEPKARKMQGALDLINELRCSLDFEKGGVIATNLDAIYSYITKRLLTGDVERDLSNFNEAIRILSELKEAWEGIASGDHMESGSASVAINKRAGAAQLAA